MERIKACETQDELAEYLLSCVSIIKEYTSETGHVIETTQNVANLKVASKRGVQRNDIYKKYLRDIEGEWDGSVKTNFHAKPCSQCGKHYTRVFDESASEEICRECGAVEYILSEEVGFKEEQELEKHVVYSYKRENHFNEWISQFQAKESTHVPDEVIGKLRTEFRKQKVKDLNEITHEKVKGLLKKLGYSKYYEHVPYIATIVSGITPPTMPQALEDRLRLMFHAIQAPFEKHKPSNRKNFLS